MRSSEEIDIVGVARNRVTLAGEAKWTTAPLGMDVLVDLLDYKLPALSQAGFVLAKQPLVVLYGKSGYSRSLRDRAGDDDHLILVDVPSALVGEGNVAWECAPPSPASAISSSR